MHPKSGSWVGADETLGPAVVADWTLAPSAVGCRLAWYSCLTSAWSSVQGRTPVLHNIMLQRGWLSCCAVSCPVLQGDVETLTSMLKYGRQILSQVVDENRRR